MIKKSFLAGVVIATLSTSSFAKNNFYVSMQGGIGGMDTSNVTTNGAPYTSYDLRDGNAWRPAIGYLFDLGNGADIGLELGYASYPNNEYTLINRATQIYSGHYIDLLAVGKLHFSSVDDGFYGLLKAGTAFVTQNFDGENLYGTTVINDTYGTAPEVGLGLGYDFSQNIGIDATVNRVFASNVNPQDTMALETQLASVTTILLGITLHIPT